MVGMDSNDVITVRCQCFIDGYGILPVFSRIKNSVCVILLTGIVNQPAPADTVSGPDFRKHRAQAAAAGYPGKLLAMVTTAMR